MAAAAFRRISGIPPTGLRRCAEFRSRGAYSFRDHRHGRRHGESRTAQAAETPPARSCARAAGCATPASLRAATRAEPKPSPSLLPIARQHFGQTISATDQRQPAAGRQPPRRCFNPGRQRRFNLQRRCPPAVRAGRAAFAVIGRIGNHMVKIHPQRGRHVGQIAFLYLQGDAILRRISAGERRIIRPATPSPASRRLRHPGRQAQGRRPNATAQIQHRLTRHGPGRPPPATQGRWPPDSPVCGCHKMQPPAQEGVVGSAGPFTTRPQMSLSISTALARK